MDKPRVFFAIPDGPLKAHMFTESWRARLEDMAHVMWNREGRDLTSEELARRLPGADALITGWGSPKITAGALDGGRAKPARDSALRGHGAQSGGRIIF